MQTLSRGFGREHKTTLFQLSDQQSAPDHTQHTHMHVKTSKHQFLDSFSDHRRNKQKNRYTD